ncbi:exodeoxyribonuclease III [Halothiobacillus sp. DCM-1]|uniref:exodeoxyribonuclease III n=1 Tax=Halothiobacillus sp. DCM-1 TaxID=3112558 RepID=UPI0032491701
MTAIATWNVNSLNVRLPQVCDWLAAERPSIVGLQELKQVNEAVDTAALQAAGYRALLNGQKTYNGVALLYRQGLPEPTEICTEIPGFDDPQRRVIAATFGRLRVINAYVVNGESLDSDKFAYKLRWLAAFTDWLRAEAAAHDKLVIMGDFNIAPTDADVYDPAAWQNAVLCSPAERQAFAALLALGLTDTLGTQAPAGSFTWWDYRAAGFRRNLGLRIDHILVSPALAATAWQCRVDKTPRGWERPSDHAPVLWQTEAGAALFE